jgi:hypothetical protein
LELTHFSGDTAMKIWIEDLLHAMGLTAIVLTDGSCATVSTTLPSGCTLHGRNPVHVGDWNAGSGRATGTLKRQKDGGTVLQDLRYWPPEGGTLELDITIDAIDDDTLRCDTLHSEWLYKEGPTDGLEGLVGETVRACISRTGNEVTLVLPANDTAWTFASNY